MSDIPIWDTPIPGFDPALGQSAPSIAPYLVENGKTNAAVVVCPGGGYQMKADHEGEPIARWLNTLGIAAFVLNYRVNPYRHPYPVMDARRALAVVRQRAEEWHIDPQRVGILGFSAGGHLAASAATYPPPLPMPDDLLSGVNAHPDALILCYPVISFGAFGHVGSMENLLGPDPSQALRDEHSAERNVSARTPPTFLWHTADDLGVPVENSLLFAQALSQHRVPFELHVYPSGEHGLGLAGSHPRVAEWTTACARWLATLGY